MGGERVAPHPGTCQVTGKDKWEEKESLLIQGLAKSLAERKGRRKSRSSSRDLPSHWQRGKGGERVDPHPGTYQVTGREKREEKESLLIQGLAKSLAERKGRRKSRSSSRDLSSHWQREKGGERVAPHPGTCQVTGREKREEKESLLIQGLAKSLAERNGRKKSRSSSRDLPSHWQREKGGERVAPHPGTCQVTGREKREEEESLLIQGLAKSLAERKGRRKSYSSSRYLPSHWQREKGGGRVAPHPGTCQVTGREKREEKESLLIQGLAKSLAERKGRRKSRSSSRDLPSHWQREKGGGRVTPHPGTCQVTGREKREEEESLLIQGFAKSLAERKGRRKSHSSSRDLPSHWQREKGGGRVTPHPGICQVTAERNESKKLTLAGECVGYASYMGEWLATLDAMTRYIAQHQMNHILFQALMGTPFPPAQCVPRSTDPNVPQPYFTHPIQSLANTTGTPYNMSTVHQSLFFNDFVCGFLDPSNNNNNNNTGSYVARSLSKR